VVIRCRGGDAAVQEVRRTGRAAEEIRRVYEYTDIRLYNQAEAE
ncbi:ParA family protein, partial [Sphingomonas koreensis]